MISLVNSLDLARFGHFLPFLLVVLAIIFLMLAKIMRTNVTVSFLVAMLMLACAWLAVGQIDLAEGTLGFFPDNLGQLGIKILLPAVMLIGLMIAQKPIAPERKIESLLLMLISSLGAMFTLASHNWMLLFMGLQCMSLPLYGLIAFDTDKQSLSSSARYLLLSFVAMAIMLFGILLLYAATGTMDIVAQGAKIKELMPASNGLVGLSLLLIFIGLSFKVSLFPFHAWAPEVYQGARLFVVSYLLVVVKSVVIIFIMRIAIILVGDNPSLNSMVAVMALLSMWVGNGMMIRQESLIRLLAFLSIGHLGALMIPILAHNQQALDAIFLDIIAFGLAMLLIFSCLKGLNQDRSRGIMLKDLQGLYYKRPWSSIALALALISITGFPLTAGFVGKLAIFQSGFAASMWHMIFHFVLSSIIALAVIAKIIAMLWQENPIEHLNLPKNRLSPLLFCAGLAILAMGIYPEPWIAFVKSYTVGVL